MNPSFDIREAQVQAPNGAKLRYAHIAPDLVAYKLEDMRSARLGDAQPTYSHVASQGFSRAQQIEDFLHGRTTELKTLTEFFYLPQDLQDRVREHGLQSGLREAPASAFRQEVFDLFEEGSFEPERVVQLDQVNNLLRDRYGRPLPTGVYFSYLVGGIDDSSYDLDKVLEVLRSNPRVRAVGNFRAPSLTELTALDIPAQARGGVRTKDIPFLFTPSVEEMQTLWAWCENLKPHFPAAKLHEAVLALDMLGLRRAGALKPEKTRLS